jgi:hypothetical protein
MARDAKLVLRFNTQAFAAANAMRVETYNGGSSASGAVFYMTSAGTTSFFYQGFSNTLNFSGFRTTNADQSIIVSGETSGIVNDPAIVGNTGNPIKYVHAICQTYGSYGNTSFEAFLQGASDSGTGTAGSDWSPISGSVALVSGTDSTIAGAVSSGQLTAASHGLSVGDVIIPRTSNGTVNAFRPLVVVAVPDSGTAHLSQAYGFPRDTTLSAASLTYTKPTSRRTIAIPVGPNAKPWVRLAVRAIPAAAGAVPIQTGVFFDQVFLSVGRDTAAVA